MRNDAGELTYSLDFYKYENVDKSNDPEDRIARRWTYGTFPAQSPDMLIDPLDRGIGLDDGPKFTDLDFQINQGEMINDKLNLDYLADVGLGEDDGYTVHVLERKGVSYAGKSGTLYAEILTDHDQGKKDSDYLSAGVWMLIPSDGKADNFRTGVFADGGNYYGIGITRLLSGEVTYSGKAIGFHTMTGEKRVTQRLTGDVKLTANFGDKEDGAPQMATRGSIDGTIGNIKLDGMDPAGTSSLIVLPTITMNTAGVDDEGDDARGDSYKDANEFQTNPSVISLDGTNGLQSVGQIGGESYKGLWGVAFYGDSYGDETTKRTDSGNGEESYANKAFEANVRPSGVAGVVKGAAGNNRAFIASFIAKEE